MVRSYDQKHFLQTTAEGETYAKNVLQIWLCLQAQRQNPKVEQFPRRWNIPPCPQKFGGRESTITPHYNRQRRKVKHLQKVCYKYDCACRHKGKIRRWNNFQEGETWHRASRNLAAASRPPNFSCHGEFLTFRGCCDSWIVALWHAPRAKLLRLFSNVTPFAPDKKRIISQQNVRCPPKNA